jgi:hypothetical protein
MKKLISILVIVSLLSLCYGCMNNKTITKQQLDGYAKDDGYISDITTVMTSDGLKVDFDKYDAVYVDSTKTLFGTSDNGQTVVLKSDNIVYLTVDEFDPFGTFILVLGIGLILLVGISLIFVFGIVNPVI